MTEPVTLEEAKRHVRVETDEDDALLTGLIAAAREHVERMTGLVLTEREVVEQAAFESSIELSSWPVASVLVATDSGAAVDAANYVMRSAVRPARLTPVFSSWGTAIGAQAVVTVQAGYAVADVPAALKAALLLIVGWLYTNRGDQGGDMPPVVSALLRPYRLLRV